MVTTTRRVSRPLGGTAALLLAGALALTGCGGIEQMARGAVGAGPASGDEGGVAVEHVTQRASLEEMLVEFGEAEERVKAAISEVLPGADWEVASEHDTSPCRENRGQDDVRALRLYGTMWSLRLVPTEEQWSRILEKITPIIAEYGYGEGLMDTPTANGAVFKVAGVYDGSAFSVAYKKTVVTHFISGCHIPAG